MKDIEKIKNQDYLYWVDSINFMSFWNHERKTNPDRSLENYTLTLKKYKVSRVLTPEIDTWSINNNESSNNIITEELSYYNESKEFVFTNTLKIESCIAEYERVSEPETYTLNGKEILELFKDTHRRYNCEYKGEDDYES